METSKAAIKWMELHFDTGGACQVHIGNALVEVFPRLIARLRDTTWGHKAAAPAANFLDLAVDSSIISSYSLHDVWLLLSGGGLRVL